VERTSWVDALRRFERALDEASLRALQMGVSKLYSESPKELVDWWWSRLPKKLLKAYGSR